MDFIAKFWHYFSNGRKQAKAAGEHHIAKGDGEIGSQAFLP
jgi:hypothetical protein